MLFTVASRYCSSYPSLITPHPSALSLTFSVISKRVFSILEAEPVAATKVRRAPVKMVARSPFHCNRCRSLKMLCINLLRPYSSQISLEDAYQTHPENTPIFTTIEILRKLASRNKFNFHPGCMSLLVVCLCSYGVDRSRIEIVQLDAEKLYPFQGILPRQPELHISHGGLDFGFSEESWSRSNHCQSLSNTVKSL